MKKTRSLLLTVIITLGIVLTACGSKTGYTRNPDYTYGTLGSDGIESVYELVGAKSQISAEDFSDFGKGSKGNYIITISETASGGVVAYGEGVYVYSPDKNDKNGVQNALISECMHNKNN